VVEALAEGGVTGGSGAIGGAGELDAIVVKARRLVRFGRRYIAPWVTARERPGRLFK